MTMKKYPYVLVWIGFFFTKIIYGFMVYRNHLENPMEETTLSLNILIIFLLSVVTVSVAIFLSRGLYYRYTRVYKMLGSKIPFHEKENPEDINYMIFNAIGMLNEVPAILGLVVCFQTSSLDIYFALAALSLIGWGATKPRKVKMSGSSSNSL